MTILEPKYSQYVFSVISSYYTNQVNFIQNKSCIYFRKIMCRKCTYTKEEWIDVCGRKIELLNLSPASKKLFANILGILSVQNRPLPLHDDIPQFYHGMFYSRRSDRKVEHILRDYITFVKVKFETIIYDIECDIDYLEHLHPRRRRLWHWYDHSRLLTRVQFAGCWNCVIRAREEADEEIDESELYPDDLYRLPFGIIYFADYFADFPADFSVSHACASSYGTVGEYRHRLCWRYSLSLCENTDYVVFQLNRPPPCDDNSFDLDDEYPERNCGICYFKTDVLNELIESVGHQANFCPARQWPHRRIKTRITDFNLLRNTEKQRLIFLESDALAEKYYNEGRMHWQSIMSIRDKSPTRTKQIDITEQDCECSSCPGLSHDKKPALLILCTKCNLYFCSRCFESPHKKRLLCSVCTEKTVSMRMCCQNRMRRRYHLVNTR